MKGHDNSKFKQRVLWRLRVCLEYGDCTDHQTRYARGLIDQSVYEAEDCTDHRARYAWGLVDQYVYETVDYVDYHTNWLSIKLRGDFNFLDLVTRLILRLPTSSGTTS